MELWIEPFYESALNNAAAFKEMDFFQAGASGWMFNYKKVTNEIAATVGELQHDLYELDFSIDNEECTAEEGNAYKKILTDNYLTPALEYQSWLDWLLHNMTNSFRSFVLNDAYSFEEEEAAFLQKPIPEGEGREEWDREYNRMDALVNEYMNKLGNIAAFGEMIGDGDLAFDAESQRLFIGMRWGIA